MHHLDRPDLAPFLRLLVRHGRFGGDFDGVQRRERFGEESLSDGRGLQQLGQVRRSGRDGEEEDRLRRVGTGPRAADALALVGSGAGNAPVRATGR